VIIYIYVCQSGYLIFFLRTMAVSHEIRPDRVLALCDAAEVLIINKMI
jgi:hypothetical protein